MRVHLGLLGLLLAASCGGDGAAPTSPPRVPAWGLPGGEPGPRASDVERGSSEVVLFVVLDGVSCTELTVYGGDAPSTPNLDAVASGAQVFEDAIAVSTGGNGAIASLLTGRHPREHGVVSLHDLGRSSLSASETTLAECFRERGWATIASLSEARHARGLSGFAQGFDVYEAPRLGEASRPADAVALGARDALERAVTTTGRGAFAFLVFGDLADERRREQPPAERAAPFVESRLRPFADRRADIAQQLERLDAEPGAGIDELGKLLGRARGSDAARAYRRAMRDATLAEIDAAIASLLDVIEGAGRAETTTVVVCAPRGRAPDSGEWRVGPRFVPSVLEVPLLVRWSHGASAGRVAGTTSVLRSARALDEAFGLGLPPSRFSVEGTAYVSTAAFTSHAAVREHDQIERYGLDMSTFAFDRATGAKDAAWAADDPAIPPFQDFSAPATLAITRAAGAPPITARWRAADGRVLAVGLAEDPATRAQRLNRVSGSAELDGATGDALTLGLEDRATSVRLELSAESATLLPEEIAIGSMQLSELPVLFVPSDESTTVGADEFGLVDLKRSRGIWWRLAVGGEGPVEMLVGTWPPRSPDDAMEVVAGGPVLRHDVPGRDDLVRLVGTAPFDLQIKRKGNEEFAIACRHGDRFLRPDEMVTDQLRFGTPTSVAMLVPSWQPAVGEALGDVTDALYASEVAEAPVTVSRTSIGPVRGVEAALDTDALLFIKALPSGE